VKDDSKYRFLQALSQSLDVTKAMEDAHISRSDAGKILEDASRALKVHSGSKKSMKCLHLYVDGASRGNPGAAGAGAIIKDEKGNVIKRFKRYLGVTTNNVAEYQALILALKGVADMRYGRVKIFSDSELLVKQINGEYGVKSRGLIPLYTKVCSLLSGLDEYVIIHIDRGDNRDADRIANMAIDEHL
jgi:ribonuclease HI